MTMKSAELLQGRIAKEWNQAETARRVAVSQTCLSSLGTGKSASTNKLMRRVMKVK